MLVMRIKGECVYQWFASGADRHEQDNLCFLEPSLASDMR